MKLEAIFSYSVAHLPSVIPPNFYRACISFNKIYHKQHKHISRKLLAHRYLRRISKDMLVIRKPQALPTPCHIF